MTSDTGSEQTTHTDANVIPDDTRFVIVDVDHDNEMVQIEFSLDGKAMRKWGRFRI